jgi:hypothetical protein
MLDLFPTAQTDEPYDFVAERRIFLHFVKELPGSIAAPDDEGIVHPYSGDQHLALEAPQKHSAGGN